MSLWLTVLIIGVLTLAIRLSLILSLQRVRLPDWVRRALRFVPIAVLSALVLPELVVPHGALALAPSNARLVAGALAVLVAATTRNALLGL